MEHKCKCDELLHGGNGRCSCLKQLDLQIGLVCGACTGQFIQIQVCWPPMQPFTTLQISEQVA